mmetsp:Transcript_44716/g.104433  ORF Transcript_44716/g.104433 Transcript_44716/m.104433 type:complete len:319 (+) Transcript_44716:1123-2079(+)
MKEKPQLLSPSTSPLESRRSVEGEPSEPPSPSLGSAIGTLRRVGLMSTGEPGSEKGELEKRGGCPAEMSDSESVASHRSLGLSVDSIVEPPAGLGAVVLLCRSAARYRPTSWSSSASVAWALMQSKKACAMASSESGRSAGSLVRHRSTKSLNSALQCSGCSSCGGGLLGMRKSTRTGGCTSHSGGRICASSMAVMPSDHMSVRWSYCPASIISGLIHIGVPITVLRFVRVSLTRADTPKSASLICPPAEMSMLPALTSLWTICCSECKYRSPASASEQTAAICASEKGWFMCRNTACIEQRQNSIEIQRRLSHKYAP